MNERGRVGKELDKENLHFSDSFGKVVGDGSDTRFWEERWISNRILGKDFPRLFRLEVDKDATVKERGEWRGEEWVWKWGWRREPRGRELGELENLFNVIRENAPKKELKYRVVWRKDPEGIFTVRKVRSLLEENRCLERGNIVETIWVKTIPKKISIFIWRARLGRLPCRSVLDSMGIDLNSTLCPRCGNDIETIDHALTNCE